MRVRTLVGVKQQPYFGLLRDAEGILAGSGFRHKRRVRADIAVRNLSERVGVNKLR